MDRELENQDRLFFLQQADITPSIGIKPFNEARYESYLSMEMYCSYSLPDHIRTTFRSNRSELIL